jgi:hypothetical protein
MPSGFKARPFARKLFHAEYRHVQKSDIKRAKVKVKFALEQVMKAHSGNRGIALFFL